ncbi:beta-N-acetylhexosaminidase [Oceanobacillus jeddahense]|uniref:Beta-N-acetylhexosaminidase n=1 Tax=Oceanobacillus jeddahense TaxID=1462527 RepID=A0ABY5JV42_9BACI|nr:beta-N-acetylhexosaminidase [Oceanobacillus jeddahense]UUI04235.1 beta-N-acetylhexosaminidase [Oceanobacillus jeddahense]
MKLHLTGDVSQVKKGLKQLLKELDIELSEEGHRIQVIQKEGPLSVKNNHGKSEIVFQEKIHFFRGFGLWLEHFYAQKDFNLVEYPQFTMQGAMLDASRNAVMTVDGIKKLVRKIAMMGLNTLMVYTEDTYTVKEYPYFGYMRGRYTEEELRECDQYAANLGIEMIPCIQTLAHLTEALKWNYAIPIRDTADILLAGSKATYTFLENLIEAASRPFQSKRIHIGMDEAHQLGLGKYLDVHGYEKRFDIMNKHLQEVTAITERKKLKPMIWSDMYFRLGSKHGGYYDLESDIPESVISSIPDAQLVYWDYYHDDEQFYRTFIQKHKALKDNPVFAGGVWTWNGISPNYGKAFATTEAALRACKKEKVKEIFVTMWGDNGAETPMMTALPVLQLFAEHAYHETFSEAHLQERFQFCAGANFDDFILFNQLDETPGVNKDNLQTSNPSKLLLWQDILIGLYDENIKNLPLNKHYELLTAKLEQAAKRNTDWSLLFHFYQQLSHVLSIKAELGKQIKELYDKQDRSKLQTIIPVLEEVKERVDTMRKIHRTLWFSINKPFGWEIIEIRYGGVLTRIDTVMYRLNQYIEGEISKIGELEEERLYFEGPYPMQAGSLGRNLYHRIVTAGNLS